VVSFEVKRTGQKVRVIQEFELSKDKTIIKNSRDPEKVWGIDDFELKKVRVNQVRLYHKLL